VLLAEWQKEQGEDTPTKLDCSKEDKEGEVFAHVVFAPLVFLPKCKM
jgi:hypothetical protein